uniref:Uncharacterized protein n=1 Tax=Spermophilus dauricus TaxID=99837 RepID=A0A8C9QHG5_SPEDA
MVLGQSQDGIKKMCCERCQCYFGRSTKLTDKLSQNMSRITELKEEREKMLVMTSRGPLKGTSANWRSFRQPFSRRNTRNVRGSKENLQEENDALESRVEAIQQMLADLEVQLCVKFGSKINSEADES